MAGTFNISRDIWTDVAFKLQPFTEREAYMWLTSEASWKSRKKRVGNIVVDLERGQMAASVRFIAEAWGWKKSTVDRFLKRLQKWDMIWTDCTTGVSVLTICNYEEVQNKPKDFKATKLSDVGQQRDNGGTNENKGLISEGIHKEDNNISLSMHSPPNEISGAIQFFNGTAKAVGWPLVQKITPARAAALRGRIKDVNGLENWCDAIERASKIPFLTGQSSSGWFANFDWLSKPNNFTKLMEGNYDIRTGQDARANGAGGSQPSSNADLSALIAAASAR